MLLGETSLSALGSSVFFKPLTLALDVSTALWGVLTSGCDSFLPSPPDVSRDTRGTCHSLIRARFSYPEGPAVDGREDLSSLVSTCGRVRVRRHARDVEGLSLWGGGYLLTSPFGLEGGFIYLQSVRTL